MQRYLSVSEAGASVPASVPFASLTALAAYTTVGTAGVTAAEQTLDTSTNLVTESVATIRKLYKGGAFELEFLLKGWEINDRGWMKHLQAMISQGRIVNGNSPTGVGLLPIDV
jgi:hypothetical protein